MSDSPAELTDEHVVFFTTAMGDPAAERYPTLRAAVGRVESLCNDDEVTDAKVYRLVPVPLNVRPYFKVEVGTGAPRPPRMDSRPDAPEVRADDRPVEPYASPDAHDLRDPHAGRHESRSDARRDELPPPPQQRVEEPTLPAEPEERGRSLGFFVH